MGLYSRKELTIEIWLKVMDDGSVWMTHRLHFPSRAGSAERNPMIPTGCAPTPHPTATTAGGRPSRPDWPRVGAAGGDRGRPSQTLRARRRAGRARPPTLPNRGACSPTVRGMASVDSRLYPTHDARVGGGGRRKGKKKNPAAVRARDQNECLAGHARTSPPAAASHSRTRAALPPLQSLPERGGPALQACGVSAGVHNLPPPPPAAPRRGRRRRAAPTATTRTACTPRAGIVRVAPPRPPSPPPALDTPTPPTPFPSARCGGGGGGGTPAAAAHPPRPARPPRDRSPRTAVRSAGRRAGRPPARPRCRHGRRRRRAARPASRAQRLFPPSILPHNPPCFPPVVSLPRLFVCMWCIPLSLHSLWRPPLTRV